MLFVVANGVPDDQKAEVSAAARTRGGGAGIGLHLLASTPLHRREAGEPILDATIPGAEASEENPSQPPAMTAQESIVVTRARIRSLQRRLDQTDALAGLLLAQLRRSQTDLAAILGLLTAAGQTAGQDTNQLDSLRTDQP